MIRKTIIAAVGVGVLTCLGCKTDRGPDDMPQLFPCSIFITMDGKPLAGASVHCLPPEGGKWYGSGVTDSGGAAKIKTLSRYPGLAEGDYIVSVMKTIPDPDFVPTPDRGPSPVHIADVRYADAATSPLRCVVLKEKNGFKFNIEPAKTNPHP